MRLVHLPFSKPSYVKYDPSFSQLSVSDERHIDQITADIRYHIEHSPSLNHINYHTRDAHAKGYCALQAEFIILPNLPKEYAQGMYAHAGRHEAVIRFSNGAGRVNADRKLGLAQGLAIKVLGIAGKKVVPDETDSPNIDFNLTNFPFFFCNRIEDYAFVMGLALRVRDYLDEGAKARALWTLTRLMGSKQRPPKQELAKIIKSMTKILTIAPKNALLYDYFSIGAVRHGDYMAKIRATPTKAAKRQVRQRLVPILTQAEAVRPLILDEIRQHDYEFDIQIQLCRNLDDQPINELTTEWREKDAPFVTVAKLRIPRQAVPDDGNFEIMEHLSFTPFRCLPEHRPIGKLQQARLRAYQTASTTRHQLNGKPRQEPTSLAQLFGETVTPTPKRRIKRLFKRFG